MMTARDTDVPGAKNAHAKLVGKSLTQQQHFVFRERNKILINILVHIC